MAKEPSDKLRKTTGITPDSTKPLKELFGGDKKRFEPIEDDEDDIVAPASAKGSSFAAPAIAAPIETTLVSGPGPLSNDPENKKETTRVPEVKSAPAKPAAKGIKSHWANLAAALGLRKKDPEQAAVEKQASNAIPATATQAPTEPQVANTDWVAPVSPRSEIAFDDLFANAPDLTESQVAPEAFLGAGGLADVDLDESEVSLEATADDPDYVEFELAELDPVDRPRRIGRTDIPPPAAETSEQSETARSGRRRRRRRKPKSADAAAAMPDADTLPEAETVEVGDAEPLSSDRKPRARSEKSGRSETPDRGQKPQRSGRTDRGEKADSSDQSERGEKLERGDTSRSSGRDRRPDRDRDDRRKTESTRSEPRSNRRPDPVESDGNDYIEYDGDPDLELTDDAKRVTTWREAIDAIIDGNLANRKRGGRTSGGGSYRPPRNNPRR